jgi:N-formylglutamate amidohydrolase
LKEYYRPFHNELQAALSDKEIKGLFDCHSLYGTGPVGAPDAGKERKDVILSNNGDDTGSEDPVLGKTTCSAEILHVMRNAFQRYGFSVSINDPYAGGFITNHYGRVLAGTGRIAVQIEINQDLYCEAGTSHLISEKLEILRPKIMSLFQEIAKELPLNQIGA